jgi:hypothetical protein
VRWRRRDRNIEAREEVGSAERNLLTIELSDEAKPAKLADSFK